MKLTETWKAINIEEYPTKLYPMKGDSLSDNSGRVLRESSIRVFKDNAKTELGSKSFCISGAKLWNQCPKEIRETKTLIAAKKLIKSYSKTMPI